MSEAEEKMTAQELERRSQVDWLIAQGKTQLYYDLDKLQNFAEHAFQLAGQPLENGATYQRGMAGAIALMASRLSSLDCSREALEKAMSGLALLDPEVPDTYQAELLGVVAQARFNMGDFSEGLSIETKALEMARKLDDKVVEGRLLAAMAIMHFLLEHQELALELGEQALLIYREVTEPTLLLMLLNNVAEMYLISQKFAPAFAYAEESLKLCETNGCINFEPAILDTLASLHLETGNLDEAERYARRSIQISQITGNASLESACSGRLSSVLAAQGKLEEAINYAEKALEGKEKLEKTPDIADLHRLLVELYEKNGDFAKALQHMKTVQQMEEEKSKHQLDERVSDLRVQHHMETVQKDAEIYQLRALALEGEVEQQKLDQIKLETENSLDPLTGLFNRRHLPVLKNQFREGQRTGSHSSLLMLDIDHFKNINDTYGHLAGDQIIVSLAQEIRNQIRGMDTPVRFGGEEFLVFLPNMDLEQAIALADRIRAAVAAKPIIYQEKSISITISVGVSSDIDQREADFRALIDYADQALYQAKESGRNRVKTISPQK